VGLLKTVIREKKIIKRCYKLWIKGKLSKDRFIEERKKLRRYLEKKQREKREKKETELRSLKKEAEVWKYINKKRGKNMILKKQYRRRRVKGPFQRITGRFRGRRDRMQERRRRMEETENIEKKEIKEVVRKMKNKKVARIDRIPIEVWKNTGKDFWKSLVRLLNFIWRNGIIPKEKSIIVLINTREVM